MRHTGLTGANLRRTTIHKLYFYLPACMIAYQDSGCFAGIGPRLGLRHLGLALFLRNEPILQARWAEAHDALVVEIDGLRRVG